MWGSLEDVAVIDVELGHTQERCRGLEERRRDGEERLITYMTMGIASRARNHAESRKLWLDIVVEERRVPQERQKKSTFSASMPQYLQISNFGELLYFRHTSLLYATTTTTLQAYVHVV